MQISKGSGDNNGSLDTIQIKYLLDRGTFKISLNNIYLMEDPS